jgi:four helix bundle protein
MDNMNVKSFEDLIAWQKAFACCKKVFETSRDFPKDELFGLTAHIKKSAVSIPSNIAEGFERKNDREFNTFIQIALGSIAELKTQILIARDLGYLLPEKAGGLLNDLDECRKVIHGLKRVLKI